MPGLRTRIQLHVVSLLETAVEIRELFGGWVDNAPLLTRVGDYDVTYTLDLEHCTATILSVELTTDADAWMSPTRA